jgi:hypothetical protein
VLVGRSLGVGRLADGVFAAGKGVRIGRHVAAAGMVVGPLHGFQLFVDVQLLAGFEQQHFHAVRRENVRGHAAGGAGADYDGVVSFTEIDFVGHIH